MNYWIFGRWNGTKDGRSRMSFGARLLCPGQLTLLGVGAAEKEQECLPFIRNFRENSSKIMDHRLKSIVSTACFLLKCLKVWEKLYSFVYYFFPLINAFWSPNCNSSWLK